jgi:hypothetical protein
VNAPRYKSRVTPKRPRIQTLKPLSSPVTCRSMHVTSAHNKTTE